MHLIILTTLSFLFARAYAGTPFASSTISPDADGTLCIAATANANGAELVSTDCDPDDPGQIWTSDGKAITGYNGKMCWDVTNGVKADGTPMQIWQCSSGSANQQISLSGNTFNWGTTNQCLDLTLGELCAGNQLQVWTCNHGTSNNHQVWHVNPVKSVYTISPQQSPSLCVTGGSTNGAQIALQKCGGSLTALQQWTNSTSTYHLSNNKCLDVPSGNTANGVVLQVWDCTSRDGNQVFPKTTDNRLTFAHGCLDVTGGVYKAGTKLQMWHCTSDDPNQAWNFNLV